MVKKDERGIYIHIPFCKQKCYYCDFISYANKTEKVEKYVQSLIKEIENKKQEIEESNIATIYIGGGTPSLIEAKYVKEILKEIEKLNTCDNKEITIEVNPGTVTEEKLETYINSGINRLSIGLQSTDNNLLKQIGRIHTFEEFLNTYNLARKVGFKNINIDLMLGLPNQSIENLKTSIEEITKLNPEHISVYSLILEEGTPIEKMIKQKIIELPNEEIERQMYWYVKNMLELKGYNHYEISNFSKKGFESKHNINCWKQKEYFGFGVAAHSYYKNERYSNIINIEKYIENISKNQFEKNKITEEIQGKEDKEKEYMILGLRKLEGVEISEFKEKFIENPIFIYKKELEKLTKEGLILIDGNNIRLTNKGLDFANIVWEEFI